MLAATLLGATAAGHAATITDPVDNGVAPGTGSVTPLQVSAASFSGVTDASTVVLGPHSFLLNFSNSYDSTYTLKITLTTSNGSFGTISSMSVYTKTSAGKLGPATVTGCNRQVVGSLLFITNCAATSGSHIDAIGITTTYTNAPTLAQANRTITMTADIVNNSTTTTVYEQASATTVATSVAAAYSLLTATSGNGNGSISRSVAGTGTSYASGTSVVLTATPAAGSTFAGWSGACSGTTSTCTVTVDGEKSATAAFDVNFHVAAVHSTSQRVVNSYLRFYNAGTAAGTARITLADPVSGSVLAQWTSTSIAAGTAAQFDLATVEAAATAGFTKPGTYSVTVAPNFTGAFQHVVWDTSIGTLTNQSTCDTQAVPVATRLTHIHSSRVMGYPSTVIIHNTGTAGTAATLTVADASNGQTLGSTTTAVIPANGEVSLTASQIETNANVSPNTNSITYYVVSVPTSFTGYLVHQVTNTQSSVVSDMTGACAFPAH